MKTATYIEKDQNWMDGSTTYWFDVDGDEYGVVEGENAGVVDSDSDPIDYNDGLRAEIEARCIVTDEMRAE